MDMTEVSAAVDDVSTWFEQYQDAIIGVGMNALIAILILVVGMYIARFAKNRAVKRLSSRGVDDAVSSFVAQMLQVVIIAAVLIAALNKIGVETTSLVAVFGAAGLAIGLALKDSLSNFSSGVMIIILKPFRSGHYVEAAGIAGTVKSIELFSTRLVTPDNKIVILPNSTVYASEIINYSMQPTRRIDIVIGISYESDMRTAKSVILDVVKENDLVLKDPEPVVAVSELADSSVNLVVRPWVNTEDYWVARFALIEAVKRALDDNNISIPFPQMDVHFDKS
jgi:small conductance mechanosensitive channel